MSYTFSEIKRLMLCIIGCTLTIFLFTSFFIQAGNLLINEGDGALILSYWLFFISLIAVPISYLVSYVLFKFFKKRVIVEPLLSYHLHINACVDLTKHSEVRKVKYDLINKITILSKRTKRKIKVSSHFLSDVNRSARFQSMLNESLDKNWKITYSKKQTCFFIKLLIPYAIFLLHRRIPEVAEYTGKFVIEKKE
ncbi:hypothetical protein [Vreelandella populi]|uniref:hypothetical protein n=1 Tax=Vreelandella populi TaxID=2498858 RepID=UPI000F8E23F8|nr:hypothetical protein [Halomonas populi]RUR51511.1 hypothetical protein ELY40_17090 [Halomonas populi]